MIDRTCKYCNNEFKYSCRLKQHLKTKNSCSINALTVNNNVLTVNNSALIVDNSILTTNDSALTFDKQKIN